MTFHIKWKQDTSSGLVTYNFLKFTSPNEHKITMSNSKSTSTKKNQQKNVYPMVYQWDFLTQYERVQLSLTFFNLQKNQERDIIRVYKNSFHVSGNPGRHQWIQSAYIAGSACCLGVNILPCRIVYNEVCASFLYSDIRVIFMKYTGNFIDFVTFDAIANSLLSVPTFSGIDIFNTGVVSFAHFIPFGLFQSLLLFHAFPCICNHY